MAKESNYQRFVTAEWTRPDFYPLDQPVDATLYRPVATWIGRLLLNPREARDPEGGCGLEIVHASAHHTDWVGRRVRLRYSTDAVTQARNGAVTHDVRFNEAAQKLASGGAILVERVNGWNEVTPLESLAAGHPEDDIIVRLVEPVFVEESPGDGGAPILRIEREPVQIIGCYMGLVTFLAPLDQKRDRWRVRHYNKASGVFDGAEEIVALPPPVANSNNTLPSTNAGLEHSPFNAEGWYITGAIGRDGLFVVQAWTPRALLRLQPQRVISGKEASWHYVRHEVWSDLRARKGTIASVLCDPRETEAGSARARWKVGDRALLLHTYSGMGGKEREPAARTGIYFGHFSFGIAEIIDEPLAGEPRFEITFYQVYTQNVDGVVAGALDWSRFIGDRQFGWGGMRPTCNILIHFDDLNTPGLLDGGDREGTGALFKRNEGRDANEARDALDVMREHLEQMVARYRIGDGRGATYVSAANNCAQDASQALCGALAEIRSCIANEERAASDPAQAERRKRLAKVATTVQAKMAGIPPRRADWRYGIENLGIRENVLRDLLRGLGSWRNALPRKMSDDYAYLFLQQDAALWLLSTYQIGGYNPNIEPIASFTF